LIFAGWSLSIIAFAQPTPAPTPTPTSVEQRVQKLEDKVQALTDKEKDFWDKLTASGPLIGGVLVAIIGGIATYMYNARQQRATDHQAAQELRVTRVQTLGELMPFLSSQDPRQVEAALVSIAELGDPELATSMAFIYKGEGGVGALERLAGGPDAAIAQTARATLASVFADVRESVATIFGVPGHVMGTAVFVDTNTLVAPNFVITEPVHNKPAATMVRVGQAQGFITVRQPFGDQPTDIAVLESELPGNPVRIGSSQKLAIGDRVTIAGPTSLFDESEIQVISAVIEGFVADGRFRFGGSGIHHGFGGGPVFDTSGVLVGIVYGTSEGGGSALPAEILLKVLGKQPVT
jgi:S1-C subfamily serine protease